jgi:hypothetical protein
MSSTTSSEAPERWFSGFPVGSRMSWGAIFAGAVVAFAIYFLLATFGAAVGLSLTQDVRGGAFAVGAAIWAIVSMLIALFVGGWVSTRFTVGETLYESILYGALVWSVMFAFLMWLAGVGVHMGFNAMMARSATPQAAQVQQPAQGPLVANQGTAEQTGQVAQPSAAAAWWVFMGTLISMAASIGGAMLGSPYYLGGTRRKIPRQEAAPDVNPPL